MIKFELLKLENLNDTKFIEDFVQLSFKVRRPPYDLGLMSAEQAKKLIQWGSHHGSDFWIIKDSKQNTVIRLSLRVCPQKSDHGTLGFFEIDLRHSQHQEAFLFCLAEAESWFKKQGVKHVVAPVDINTWFNYRFSLPGKKFFPRYKWEPTTPPEYLELFKNSSYSHFAYYNSVFFPLFRLGSFTPGSGHLRRSYKRISSLGYSLRPFDKENFRTKELPVFHEISHEAFSDALLFEAIDLGTFSDLYAGAISAYDFSPSCVLVAPDGETAGFLFALFDGDALVIKSIALRQKYRGLKLSSGMIYSAVKMAFDQNKKVTISALVRTGITSEKIAGNSQKWALFSWTHDYVLVKKDISNE
jgi:hypothetical protein